MVLSWPCINSLFIICFLNFGLQTEKAFLKQPKVFLWYTDSHNIASFTLCLILFIYYALVMLVSVLMCFWSSKKGGKGKRPGKGGNRFWKSIGLGFKTPRDAIEGKYNIHFYFMFQIRTFYFAPIGFMLLLWLMNIGIIRFYSKY